MERGPFLDARVQKEFGRFVGVVLHTDGTDEKTAPSSIRNLKLLKERFNTKANPYYAILSPDGEAVLWSRGGVIPVDDVLAALRSVE